MTSVGIQLLGALDFNRLNAWVAELLKTRGPDIYRMKGVLNVQGEEDRFVFQGVHMVSFWRTRFHFLLFSFHLR